jgi:hypothetical protein
VAHKIIHKPLEIVVAFLRGAYNIRLMAGRNPIDALIEAKVAKISSLEKILEKLRIEIGALEAARAAIARPKHFGNGAAKNGADNAGHEKRRGRSLSDGWKRVLATIGKKGEGGADLGDIFAFCGEEGIKLKRPTLRAQMSNYVKRGYLSRTGQGAYFLTLGGRKVAGIDTQLPADAGKGSGAPALTGAPRE